LIIVTVVAVVTGVIVSQADSSVRATVSLRTQAGSDYAADGAGQVAVNMLRQSTFNNVAGTTCFSAGNTITVPYPATNGLEGGAAGSSYVQCAAEAGTGADGSAVAINPDNQSGRLFTVGHTTNGDGASAGLTLASQGSGTLYFGSATSNSNLSLSNATPTGSGTLSAVHCNGTPGCATIAEDSFTLPKFVVPTAAPAAPASMPACSNNGQVAVFLPGIYTSAAFLNNCKASWMDFTPGTYYFNFTDAGASTQRAWTIDGTVVGGSLQSGLTTTSSASAVNTKIAADSACTNSFASASNNGVEFAMGGESQIVLGMGTRLQLCASYSSAAVPTAIYGMKDPIGAVPAQTGCVVQTGPYQAAGTCQVLFEDDGSSSPSDPIYFVDGLVHVPGSSVYAHGKNKAVMEFNYGITARWLNITSFPQSSAITSIPALSPGYGVGSTIVDLKVYVCPGSSSCNATLGKLQLTGRVQIYDVSGTPHAGARQMKILSWSQQR